MGDPVSARDDIIAAARAHLGEGPRPEWLDVEWCGLFALACLHEAGIALDIEWRVGGGIVLEHPEAFPPTDDPQPGDLVVETRAPWHHQIVVSWDGLVLVTIAGNMGPHPGHVGESRVVATNPRWAFYATQPVQAYP